MSCIHDLDRVFEAMQKGNRAHENLPTRCFVLRTIEEGHTDTGPGPIDVMATAQPKEVAAVCPSLGSLRPLGSTNDESSIKVELECT